MFGTNTESEGSMTPTPKLRFVERDSYSHNGEHFREPHKVRILQQWWENTNIALTSLNYDEYGRPYVKHPGEWRDIPLETET